MRVVRIFLRGYLFVWLQYWVSKEKFLFLNSPRGFRRSLGKRFHFITLYLLYWLYNDLSFLSNTVINILWILLDAYPQSSAIDSHILSDPMSLKTPPGDYDTRNFFQEIVFMIMLLTLLTLITIFLIDRTLGKAFNSWRNNKDIFRKDFRGRILWNQKQTTDPLLSLSGYLSQSRVMALLSCSFLSQMTSLQSQLQISSSLMSQRLQHLLIFGLVTIPCSSSLMLSPLLWLQNRLLSQQLRQRKWIQVFWIQWHTQHVLSASWQWQLRKYDSNYLAPF